MHVRSDYLSTRDIMSKFYSIGQCLSRLCTLSLNDVFELALIHSASKILRDNYDENSRN